MNCPYCKSNQIRVMDRCVGMKKYTEEESAIIAEKHSEQKKYTMMGLRSLAQTIMWP